MSEVVWRGAEELKRHLMPIGDLKPFPGNARRGDIQELAESLRRFGQVRAVLIYDDNTIVAGHHVTKAAQLLDWTHIAAIPAEFESRDDARDYLVADNQLSYLGNIEHVDQMTLLEEIEKRGTWEGTGFTADDLADMKALSTHKTEMVAEKDLKRHEENYREHPPDQIEHLTRSLKEHGFYRNIVIAQDGTVLAGHGILEAARNAGLKKIPVTRLPCAPDSPEALKVLAGDNELGRLGALDDRTLTELLKRVQDGDVSNLLGTGYDAQTLANLVVVSRPESEVQGFDNAAEWIGLPEFDTDETPILLILTCDTEEDRDELIEQLGLVSTRKNRQTWSARYPAQENQDLGSLRFDFDEA